MHISYTTYFLTDSLFVRYTYDTGAYTTTKPA